MDYNYGWTKQELEQRIAARKLDVFLREQGAAKGFVRGSDWGWVECGYRWADVAQKLGFRREA